MQLLKWHKNPLKSITIKHKLIFTWRSKTHPCKDRELLMIGPDVFIFKLQPLFLHSLYHCLAHCVDHESLSGGNVNAVTSKLWLRPVSEPRAVSHLSGSWGLRHRGFVRPLPSIGPGQGERKWWFQDNKTSMRVATLTNVGTLELRLK